MVHIINTSLADDLLSVEFSLARPVYISLVPIKSTCAQFKAQATDTRTSPPQRANPPANPRDWLLLNRNDLSTFLGQQMTHPLKDMMIEQAISNLIVKVRKSIPLDSWDEEGESE